MAPVSVRGGRLMIVAENVVERLASSWHGELTRPGAEHYEEARRVWNEMIDRKPLMIVRCRGTQDVVLAVTFARDHGVPLSVRGGGHGVSGTAICEGGLVVDLSSMNGVQVDPGRRIATAEGGATWRDLDRATDVLRHYQKFMEGAPDELQAYGAFLFGPDGSPSSPSCPRGSGLSKKVCGC